MATAVAPAALEDGVWYDDPDGTDLPEPYKTIGIRTLPYPGVFIAPAPPFTTAY